MFNLGAALNFAEAKTMVKQALRSAGLRASSGILRGKQVMPACIANKTNALSGLILWWLVTAAAQANVISLVPVGQAAGVGQQVSFSIEMDFFQATVGGAFDLFYDAALLDFQSFDFDSHFLATQADPDLLVSPDDCLQSGSVLGGCSPGDAELNGIGFGNFDGIVGHHTIGVVTFQTLAPGIALLSMATNDTPWEGFYSADDASELSVVFGPGKLHIVPLPAGLWLLASAFSLTAFLRRRTGR